MTTGKSKKPAAENVPLFITGSFVIALPMMLFPEMPWWARIASIVFGGSLIVVGLRRLRREN